MLKGPAVGRYNILHAAVVPVHDRDFFAFDKIAVAVSEAEICHKRQGCYSGLFNSIGGNSSPSCAVCFCAGKRIAVFIYPEAVFFFLKVFKIIGCKVCPAWAVKAEGRKRRAAFIGKQLPFDRGHDSFCLYVNAGIQLIRADIDFFGFCPGCLEQLLWRKLVGGPPEVQKHAV